MTVQKGYGPTRYYFDDVVVDRENFRVLKDNQVRTLEPRVFDLLIYLIERPGRVIEKQELFEQIWKQAFVTDNALTRAVKEIRKALGDDASAPRYIETVPKRGYRFIAEVKSPQQREPVVRRAIDLQNEEFANYRIIRKLGQGGGGVVYLAEDTRLQRSVVLKFLPEELAADEIACKRFLREARLASVLDHPGICTVHEVNEAYGLHFIVMQYAEGETLKELLAAETFDLKTTLSIAIQIAEAIRSAHEHGIIHRDIKPGNIIVTNKGQVKILDFGLAKTLEDSNKGNTDDVTKLTRQGAQLGTPAYMSPEQARGEQADGRSDIFSFGVVFYEMATGRKPFKARSEAETMNAVINTPHTPINQLNRQMPEELAVVIDRALAKDPSDRYQSIEQMLADIRQIAAQTSVSLSTSETLTPAHIHSGRQPLLRKLWRSMNRARWLVALPAVIALVLALATLFYLRRANLNWAREQVPRIEELARSQKYFESFDLAIEAQKYLPDDARLAQLMSTISDTFSVTTDPAGAEVYLKRFSPDGFPARQLAGTTPISNLRIARGEYVLYIEKAGYAPFERTISNKLAPVGNTLLPPASTLSRKGDAEESVQEPSIIEQKLIEADKVPARMAFVPGSKYQLVSWGRPTEASVRMDGYFIDRFEVTNREYQEFINAGGYLNKGYWKYEFVKDKKAITWEEAMQEFKDRTGLPGPRSWSGQNFPEGKAEHPVTDICWYEAAAYAAFRGKQLPTIFQWEKAARDGVFTHYSETIMPWGPVEAGGAVEHHANFKGSGPLPVQSFEFGMSPYGCYNMAGNVSEWCFNQASGDFVTAGGSWDDLAYLFSNFGVFPGFYSSNRLGFRCALRQESSTDDKGAMQIALTGRVAEFSPSTREVFQAILSHYQYDKLPIDGRVTEVTDTEEWRREKITYTGADGDPVIAYLYLPRNFQKPFQVIQFVPAGDVYGGYITIAESVEMLLTPHIKSGRAVFAVALKGFKERERPADYVAPRASSIRFRDEIIDNSIDLRRGLDYLETRNDIDSKRLAYYGYSQGAEQGLIYGAVEDRYRAIVLIACGLPNARARWIAEASPSNFASHITAPKLMLNGRYDEAYAYKTEVEPLYKLLRDPKRIVVYEAGHTPPIEISVPLVNSWLDETLGPVRPN